MNEVEATEEWDGFAENVEIDPIEESDIISVYITRKSITAQNLIYIFFFISLIFISIGIFIDAPILLFVALIFATMSCFIALIEWV